MEDNTTQVVKPNSPNSRPKTEPDSDSIATMTKQLTNKSQDTQIQDKSFDPETTPDQEGTRLKITFKMPKSAVAKVPNDARIDGHHTIVESRSYKRRRSGTDTIDDHDEVKSPLFKQAEEFVSNLPTNFPSFMKTLVRSNCSYGYWMHIPMRFCKMYMPRHDTRFFLESESKETYTANYIADRTALSGGWKAFATAHELNEGDVLVFHLIEPYKFKVYVVKPSPSAEENAVPSDNQIEPDHVERRTRTRRSPKNLQLVPVEPNHVENGKPDTVITQLEDQFDNIISDDAPQNTDFKVKGIDDFTITVNGVTIDTELSDLHRTKYYELCRSQNSFLHEHLLNSINYKLAAEITAQTVNIADAIRESDFFSSQADYIVWDKTLKGFELLGMNVGFLRDRLNQLMSLYSESEEAKMLEKCREVEAEKARVEAEIRAVKLKISELKQSVGKIDSEMEKLKVNVDRHEVMFQKEVNTPW